MVGAGARDYQYQLTSSTGSFRQTDPLTGQSPCCTPTAPSFTERSSGSGCCGLVSSLLSSAGICLLVIAYTLLGALTFMALEGPARGGGNHSIPTFSHGHDKLRSQTVEKLWSITEDLNILYKDNWTRLAEQEVLKFEDSLVRKYRGSPGTKRHHTWSFPSSFLYSLTLITTIGYGSVSPRTSWGRIITIAYALIGIPLMLVYLSTIGDTLAYNFRLLYTRLTRGYSQKATQSPSKKKLTTPFGAKQDLASVQNHVKPEQKREHLLQIMPSQSTYSHYNLEAQQRPRVPILLTLSIVLGYISGGAFLFNRLENWTLLEGSYFCFTSLGTIGFGELVPGNTETSEELSVFVSSAYILVGMAVIAMCFNLVQDETISLVRSVSLWLRKDDKVGEEEDAISMSVVSS